jgi:predicted methyltransferase MtxX (methanogen marker protein 4)
VNIARQYHFNFPPFFWEDLMRRQIGIEAVFAIDHEFHSLITSLKQAIKRCNLRFAIQNSAGKEVFLTPNGFSQAVTIDNCDEFIALAVEFILNEMRPYVDQINSRMVIPIPCP